MTKSSHQGCTFLILLFTFHFFFVVLLQSSFYYYYLYLFTFIFPGILIEIKISFTGETWSKYQQLS